MYSKRIPFPYSYQQEKWAWLTKNMDLGKQVRERDCMLFSLCGESELTKE